MLNESIKHCIVQNFIWHFVRELIYKNKNDAHIYRGHIAWRPPSQGKLAPVIKLAASLAKNTIASAISVACPGRPMACVVLECSKNLAYASSFIPPKNISKQQEENKIKAFPKNKRDEETNESYVYLFYVNLLL